MSKQDKGGPSSKEGSSLLSLPNANTARQHLDSSKKSKNKSIHPATILMGLGFRQIHPGYSMFDWTKICNSGVDLAGTNGRLLQVTPEELARHCTDGDLWTAVRGVVYNVTKFASYHPGGKAQLMRGVGEDCTELFDKIHIWVSSEAILQKCVVGYLVGFSPPTKPSTLNVSVTKPPFPGEGSEKDNGTDVLSIQVPGGINIGDVARNLSLSGKEGDEELDVALPISGISIQGADVSIPIPDISIPVPESVQSRNLNGGSQRDGGSQREESDGVNVTLPIPGVSIENTDISISVPNISVPVPGISKGTPQPDSIRTHYLPPYITDHPLISKTAYETAV